MKTMFAVYRRDQLVALFAREEDAKLWIFTEYDRKPFSIERRRILLSPEISSAPAEAKSSNPGAGASEANEGKE